MPLSDDASEEALAFAQLVAQSLVAELGRELRGALAEQHRELCERLVGALYAEDAALLPEIPEQHRDAFQKRRQAVRQRVWAQVASSPVADGILRHHPSASGLAGSIGQRRAVTLCDLRGLEPRDSRGGPGGLCIPLPGVPAAGRGGGGSPRDGGGGSNSPRAGAGAETAKLSIGAGEAACSDTGSRAVEAALAVPAPAGAGGGEPKKHLAGDLLSPPEPRFLPADCGAPPQHHAPESAAAAAAAPAAEPRGHSPRRCHSPCRGHSPGHSPCRSVAEAGVASSSCGPSQGRVARANPASEPGCWRHHSPDRTQQRSHSPQKQHRTERSWVNVVVTAEEGTTSNEINRPDASRRNSASCVPAGLAPRRERGGKKNENSPATDLKSLESQLAEEVLCQNSLALKGKDTDKFRRRVSPLEHRRGSRGSSSVLGSDIGSASISVVSRDDRDDMPGPTPTGATHSNASASITGSLPDMDLDGGSPHRYEAGFRRRSASIESVPEMPPQPRVTQHRWRQALSRFFVGAIEEPDQVEELRNKRIIELTEGLGEYSDMVHHYSAKSSFDSASNIVVSPLPCFFLHMWGVLPFMTAAESRTSCCRRCVSLWYQRLVTTLVVLACCSAVVKARDMQLVLRPAEEVIGIKVSPELLESQDLQLGLLSDLPLAFGTLIGLVLGGAPFGSTGLGECYSLLTVYAQREGFLEQWASRSRKDLVATILVWLCAVLERLRGSGALRAACEGKLRDWDLLHSMAFLVTSGTLMSLVLCVLYVCGGLAIMVDMFCSKVCQRADLVEAVREWNVLQAVLRKASRSIEHCFFALQTTAFSVVIVSVVESLHGPSALILPGALVTLGVARIFLRAAKVTDKCEHVPSLINSLWFGRDMDYERQYVVEYIMRSGAGFYVFGLCLTLSIALKLMYLCVALAFGLVHRVVYS